jgi:hypothetical protein
MQTVFQQFTTATAERKGLYFSSEWKTLSSIAFGDCQCCWLCMSSNRGFLSVRTDYVLSAFERPNPFGPCRRTTFGSAFPATVFVAAYTDIRHQTMSSIFLPDVMKWFPERIHPQCVAAFHHRCQTAPPLSYCSRSSCLRQVEMTLLNI